MIGPSGITIIVGLLMFIGGKFSSDWSGLGGKIDAVNTHVVEVEKTVAPISGELHGLKSIVEDQRDRGHVLDQKIDHISDALEAIRDDLRRQESKIDHLSGEGPTDTPTQPNPTATMTPGITTPTVTPGVVPPATAAFTGTPYQPPRYEQPASTATPAGIEDRFQNTPTPVPPEPPVFPNTPMDVPVPPVVHSRSVSRPVTLSCTGRRSGARVGSGGVTGSFFGRRRIGLPGTGNQEGDAEAHLLSQDRSRNDARTRDRRDIG